MTYFVLREGGEAGMEWFECTDAPKNHMEAVEEAGFEAEAGALMMVLQVDGVFRFHSIIEWQEQP